MRCPPEATPVRVSHQGTSWLPPLQDLYNQTAAQIWYILRELADKGPRRGRAADYPYKDRDLSLSCTAVISTHARLRARWRANTQLKTVLTIGLQCTRTAC
jgi:hypothetical protein